MTATQVRTRPSGATALTPRKPRRRRWRLLLGAVVALVVLLIAAGGWLIGYSSWLSTQSVTVQGARVATPQQVLQAADVPVGVPLARQDLAGIARRVAAVPAVETVHVERGWPDTVAISVTERTAVLAVRQPDGLLLMDRHGVGFDTVASLPAGVVLAEVDPDRQALLVDVGAVASALPPALQRKVARIQAASPAAITLVLKSGVQVTWGGPGDSQLKARVTSALLKRNPRAIDVSAPHTPATR